MKKIINLTPHAVNIVDKEGKIIKIFEPAGIVARCTQSTKIVGNIEDIPISQSVFGEVIDLPSQEKNTFFIVSRLVLSACKDRDDLLVPNELVRDENGNIIGCKSLANN